MNKIVKTIHAVCALCRGYETVWIIGGFRVDMSIVCHILLLERITSDI